MILLNNQPAYKVFAKKLSETQPKGNKCGAYYFDFEGEKHWIPKTACKYNKEDGTVVIAEWKYNQLFN